MLILTKTTAVAREGSTSAEPRFKAVMGTGQFPSRQSGRSGSKTYARGDSARWSAANSPPGHAGRRVNSIRRPPKRQSARHADYAVAVLVEWPWCAGIRHKVAAERVKAIHHMV